MKTIIFKITAAIRKKHFSLLSAALICLASACNDTVKESNTDVPAAPSPTHTEAEHHHAENESIELNNGAKWKVPTEMMAHIRNMESDIDRFAKSGHSELKDFTQLGASLQGNINLLTSGCTMEGKAHDELHKWLVPYIDLVDKLNQSENTEAASDAMEEIKASLKTFNLYFE